MNLQTFLRTIIIITLLFNFTLLQAEESKAKILCDAEIRKGQPDFDLVKKYCIETAKKFEEKKEYVRASWYYLLAGELDKNVNEIQLYIKDNFSNIAHSYVLQDNLAKAKIMYSNFTRFYLDRHKEIQEDYKILFKLYPNKKNILNGGLKLWNKHYSSIEDKVYFNKGKEAYYKFKLPLSLKYFKKSLYIKEKKNLKNNKEYYQIYDWIGKLYMRLHQYSQALIYFQKQIEISINNDVKNRLFVANAYHEIGNCYERLYSYPEALNYYIKALKIFRNKLDIAFVNHDISSIYESLGDYNKALKYNDLSLKVFIDVFTENSTIVASSYSNKANIYHSMQNYDKALIYLKKSLKININERGENYYTALNHQNLGVLYQNMNLYDESLKHSRKALKIIEYTYGLNSIEAAGTYNNMGILYRLIGKNLESLKYFNKALYIKEKVLGIKHKSTANSYASIGLLYKKMKKYYEAYYYAQKFFAISLVSLDKNFTILNVNQKELYQKKNNQVAPLILSTAHLYREHNTSKAQKVEVGRETLTNWLNYKGSIFDSENTITTLYENTKDQALKSKIDDLRVHQRYLAKLLQSTPKDETDAKTYKQRVKETEEKVDVLNAEIAEKAEVFKEEQGLKTIHHTDISKHLKSDELYIDYAKAGEHYYLFTLNKNEEITFTQIDENSTKEINTLTETFRADIHTILGKLGTMDKSQLTKLNENSKQTLSKLYTLLIKQPLKDKLKSYSKLIISPDGALRLLPFEALYDRKQNKYLIEDKEIRYIPSGKELVRLFKYGTKVKSKTDKVTLFYDPDYKHTTKEKLHAWAKEYKERNTASKEQEENYNTLALRGFSKSLDEGLPYSFPRLWGSKAEAQTISSLYNKEKLKSYTRIEASEENLLQTKTPKILHLSTHGFFLNDPKITNPMLKSGLILSGAGKARKLGRDEGIVTALKLSGLDLKGTELVTLSACQTGVVDINATEGVSGLNKAFIQAGAQSVLSTLWSVADKETATLIGDFYTEAAKEKAYAKALQKAKRKMIKNGLHPFFWAGFVLSGGF